MSITLYLASTSPARRMLLSQAGIVPHILSPDVDEDAVVQRTEREIGRSLTPEEVVGLLAQAKAENAYQSASFAGSADGLVFGGDSVFVLDGVIYGKPHTPQEALRRWQLQRGRTGHLYSGHWLIDTASGKALGQVAVSEVSFAADMTDDEITAYIGSGEPLYVAGAFTIDSLGAAFIDSITGDPSTVVGLSLPTLRRMVRSLGHEWSDLWSTEGAL